MQQITECASASSPLLIHRTQISILLLHIKINVLPLHYCHYFSFTSEVSFP